MAMQFGKDRVGHLDRFGAAEHEARAHRPALHPDAQFALVRRQREHLFHWPAVDLVIAILVGDDELGAREALVERQHHVAHGGDGPVAVAGQERHQNDPTLSASASPSPASDLSSVVARTPSRLSRLSMVAWRETSIQNPQSMNTSPSSVNADSVAR